MNKGAISPSVDRLRRDFIVSLYYYSSTYTSNYSVEKNYVALMDQTQAEVTQSSERGLFY